MSKLSLDARALLRQARAQEPVATKAEMEQVRQGVSTALAAVPAKAAAAGAAGSTAGPISATAATAAAPLLKLGALVAVSAAVGVGGWQLHGRMTGSGSTDTPPAATAAVVVGPGTLSASELGAQGPRTEPKSPSPVVTATEQAFEPSEARLETTQRSASGSSTARVGAAARQVRLERELRLLAAVQARLRQGQGESALALLDQQRDSSDTSQQLIEERLAAEVFAACAAGKRDRAKLAAKRFLALAPGSPLAFRVRSSCGGADR